MSTSLLQELSFGCVFHNKSPRGISTPLRVYLLDNINLLRIITTYFPTGDRSLTRDEITDRGQYIIQLGVFERLRQPVFTLL